MAGYDLRTARASARRTVGYVAQFFSLYSIFSVGFNLKFYGGAYGLFGDKLKTAMDAVVRRFGLTGLLGKKAGGLNDGYKKRLSMAAALMHDRVFCSLMSRQVRLTRLREECSGEALTNLPTRAKPLL